MKFNIVICFSIFLVSCDLFESEYDVLMDPIKTMKIAEKKSGKQNPVFDGIVEPDFPDQKLNDSTIAGIDSNKDGVRDDVEIWINRIAEDEFVRWSMKDYYRKYYATIMAAAERQSEPKVHQTLVDFTNSVHCLSYMQEPYKREFIKKFKKETSEMTSRKIGDLFPNTAQRKQAYLSWEAFRIEGAVGGGIDYCKNSIVGHRFFYLQNKFQNKGNW